RSRALDGAPADPPQRRHRRRRDDHAGRRRQEHFAPAPPPGRAAGAAHVNVHPDLSFLSLIVTASVVVQGILALLVLASLWSWWHIFLKMFQLKRSAREADLFEENFWKGGDLNEIYQRASQARIG